VIRLTEEHRDIREMVGEFARNELTPRAEGIDEGPEFPTESLGKLAGLGLLGGAIPESHGGSGGDLLMNVVILEELAYGCGSTAMITAAHILQVGLPILRGGTDEQKRRFLPGLASGESLGTSAFTEPGEADGFRAVLEGDDWILDGVKNCVLFASRADLFLVSASLEEGNVEPRLFLLDTGSAGMTVGEGEDLLGLRGTVAASVELQGCRVAADRSFEAVDSVRDYGRLGAAAVATGIARAAHDYSVGYAAERKAFGRSIDRFEAVQSLIANAATEIEASSLLTYRAASLDGDGAFSRETSMAKLYASGAAYRATKNAVQILGGNGFSREYPVERMYRDAKTLEVLEATSDFHRRQIAGFVIGEGS
jgi:alkylation response protein AidB-like acyl-CoA dehydrogenase